MSASFNPIPTPRRPSANSSSHSSVTPASSRFRSSLVPMSRASPLRSSQRPSRVAAGAPTTSNPPVVKDLFRTTTTPKPSRTTPFAPKLPLEVTKTPASVRKLASKSTGHGMAGTASQELFKQRIPSPDPGLTGAAISEAVPNNLKNRKGTVYADQYLAHKCPPEFDDDQRRQFFCILDLRRLKFAANEIFAKKDWKLNIMNFAKEYEKSRGLIMLRYGLYEFKNVKPSEEVMRRWRKAHNLPEPAPESQKVPSASISSAAKSNSVNAMTKRKADDEAPSRSAEPLNSAFNQNKRRTLDPASAEEAHRFAPTPMKSKRKADEGQDVDENSRSKLTKSTPSAARSRLEGIINNVQSGSSTPVGSPLKRPAFGASASATSGAPMTPLFGVSKATDAPKSAFAVKSNPYGPPSNGIVDTSKLESTQFQPGQPLNTSSDSVLSTHKFGSSLAPKATNIFGYLSESSANNSGAENNDESDSESDQSQPETGSQDAPPSYEPSAVASTGTATPPVTTGTGTPSLFGLSKPAATTSNPFASSFHKSAEDLSEKPAANAAKGGLFGRVSFGSDGQPLRETSVEQTSRAPSPAKEAANGVESTKTPAKAPGDFTFNAATTPITFGGKDSSFTSATPAPAADKATESKEAEKTQPSSSSSLFGNSLFKPTPANEAPKPLFATKPSEPAASLFGAKKPEEPAQSLFGAKPSEQPADKEQKSSSSSQSLFGAKQPDQPTASLFGAKSAEQPAQSLFGTKPAEQPTQSLFGVKSPEQPAESAQQPSQPLFGSFNKPDTERPASSTSTSSLFGAKPSSQSNGEPAQSSQSLFGTSSKPAENDKTGATPAATSSIFGTQQPTPATTFSFGSSTPAPKSLFGESSKPAETPAAETQEQPKSLFGSQPTFGAQPTSNGFSAAQKEPSQVGFSFGTSTTETPSTPSAAPLFGGFQPSTEPPKPAANLFGNTATGSSAPLFGNNNSSAATGNLFGAQPANPFGAGSGTTSSKRSAEDDSQPAKKVMFGRADANNDAASQPSAPSFSFGASQSTAPASSQPEKKTMFSNVTGDSAAPNSPVAGRKILTPKRLRGAAGAGAARQASPSPAPSFEASGVFGTQPPKADAPAPSNPFGGNNNTSFTFGQQSSAPSVDNNASSSFTFGQNSQANGNATGAPSFTFGAGPAPTGGSFTFGAGAGAGGNSPNPFASTNGPSQSFGGGASGTPTPSGSFNFQFGGQSSSAPAPADQSKPLFGNQTNGATPAPTFSFTSATPQPTPTQSSSNLFAPQPSAATSIFSGLQPNGAPGANSPFPAASSINTTPVNGGTPEPQAAQADGDAEPPQEQISLTEGGPGEEDEEVLHEVRAKAIKYVDVKPGEDSPASKSPWQTQGVGQLRLLKHKNTGQVRILLRADPRGHIAMNKSLLSGPEYKADKKTVRVMVSKDDGSGLETWVLQMKEAESAVKLAAAFESWKTSNK
ncbi:hypothetical protein PFICI_06868 [Pestalotiopsis fici W106-1]|uniref:RanBD1 domain-containing protein n=1 Tax=Pestalotiopsis fici (strain W106-1 / CGMCC3.15140) TaxID=1229662 RepID=W3X9M1_PESFW|nr:uncharacterized protein PFICI_06868 [Pestalotiopsis fici W106-1]ETS81866.1 hypothetical protein PFICI_06868 [Pestalotiopsis fici W106-1]